MTKKTVIWGAVVLIVFTLVVAVGIFLMQRYNGIANAEGKVKEGTALIDATEKDQRTLAKDLLAHTQNFKDRKEYDALASDSKKDDRADEADFQDGLATYVDLVASDSVYSKDDNITKTLGNLQADLVSLRSQKLAYNSAVDLYNKKRNQHPQFFGDLLGFPNYEKFANIPSPLDTTPASGTPDTNTNATPDENSFN